MAATGVAQRNVEMARKGYEAFNKLDIETAMSTIADDMVWHVHGNSPLVGDYKGKAAVLDFFTRFGQLTEGSYQADIHDILANDEHTIVMGTSTMTRKGKTQKIRFVDIIHPAPDGRAKEFWRFVEDQAEADSFLRD
jgi:ketosteroid isomerase-like protein